MEEPGLFLTSTDEWWDVNNPETLLVRITHSDDASIDDSVINRAKYITKERYLETFGIVHVNFCGGRNMLYTH